MKKLNKKVLNINGIQFNIYSNYIEDIDRYFKEFIVPCEKEIICSYDILFEKNNDIFKKIYSKFNKEKSVIIDTFKNQTHFKNDNKFLIDTEEYICIKEGEYNFCLFTKESRLSEKYLIRIIREILIRTLESNDYFYMHGTGIEIYDKGILLLGGSGSGKTTLTTKLNEIYIKEKYLSNDRVFLNSYEMCYFPLPIVYSMGTVKSCKALDEYFISNKVLEIRRNGNYSLAKSDTKCDIPLTDINIIFPHIENTSSLYVDMILFPKLEGDYEKNIVKVNSISKSEIIRKLNDSNFTPVDTESKRKEWLVNRNISLEKIEENKRKLNEYILQNKKIFEIIYSKYSTKEEIVKELKKIL